MLFLAKHCRQRCQDNLCKITLPDATHFLPKFFHLSSQQQFVITLKIPPYLKCTAALPCEISDTILTGARFSHILQHPVYCGHYCNTMLSPYYFIFCNNILLQHFKVTDCFYSYKCVDFNCCITVICNDVK